MRLICSVRCPPAVCTSNRSASGWALTNHSGRLVDMRIKGSRSSGAKRCRRGRIRLAFRVSLLAIGLASWLGTDAAWAGALVEFANVSERGPATLVGYLARPDRGLSALLGGAGHRVERFPAVVVLHGCSGIS